MQTLTYNCPNCRQGNLGIWIVDNITFEGEEGKSGPVKINLTGVAKCNNCSVEYKMEALDVKKYNGSSEEDQNPS